ncbi:MAG: rRNA maturation RNase YbeY [Clostridia bacterium]|jgi:probable rRNA maturation factor|nr:rRNA maturation RNase YbeY [Clostridia bacterium]
MVAREALQTEKSRRLPPRRRLELSLLLTTDEEIKELNNQYRNKDAATDVLSFPLFEADEKIPRDSSLGDIVISVDTMLSQAEEYGHSAEREMAFLFLHGLLHLLGYDHELGELEEAVMFERQNQVLKNLGINR